MSTSTVQDKPETQQDPQSSSDGFVVACVSTDNSHSADNATPKPAAQADAAAASSHESDLMDFINWPED